MKLFQFNNKNFKAIGIDLSYDSKWNWINILNVIGFVHIIVVRGAFLLFRAKTLVEYGLVFYPLVSGFTAGPTVLVGIWKRGDIFKIIQKYEKFIEKSNSYRGFVIKICNLTSKI